jgi:polygalacturonase
MFFVRDGRFFCFLLWVMFASSGVVLAVPDLPLINTNNINNVTDFGALGDGASTNTVAIQNAINSAAAGAYSNGLAGGTVRFPAGTYLSGPLSLKSTVNIQLDAGAVLRMLPFGQYPLTYTTNGSIVTWAAANFISASSLHDISFTGTGAIDGQGSPWWPYASNSAFVRPIMLRLTGCNRLLIQNVTLSNSPEFHIAIGGSAANSTVMGVIIRAPSSSDPVTPGHNTDACDVAGTNILVQDCNISVGDDNFTCGGKTADVLITNCTYGAGHGVSIGSYTGGGVSNITVINCSFTGTDQGIRIKSDRDRGGLVQKISYLNITMTNVAHPILIYTEYTNTTSAYRALDSITPSVAASYPSAPVTGTTPMYQNILISNVTATTQSGRGAGLIWGLPELSVSNVVLKKVKITASSPLAIHNAQGVVLQDCQIITTGVVTNIWFYDSQIIITNSAYSNNVVLLDGITANNNGNDLQFNNANASTVSPGGLGLDTFVSLNNASFFVSNNLVMTPSNVLNFTIGSNTALMTATKNIALDGIVNIYSGPGFTNGTYNLISYGGTLSGVMPTLGLTPPGLTVSLDTNTAGLVRVQIGTSLPTVPTNVSAIPSNSVIYLSWAIVRPALSYNVKRSTIPGGPYTNVLTGIITTNVGDATVTNGQTYYYVISSVNTLGESTNSTEVSAAPFGSTNTVVNNTFFNDVFSASTINSGATNPPTGSSTSYQIVSTKSWYAGTPFISPGHLDFGIVSTSSGCVEAQALFTPIPIALNAAGDSLTLLITFTNKAGLLTQSNALGFGLYNTGQNYPVTGGMNSTATSSSSNYASGNCQSWLGYVAQVYYTNSTSRIMTRNSQVTTNGNNNQDVVTSGSSTSSYSNPSASTVGSSSSSASLVLVSNAVYTDAFKITLATPGTLTLTNLLYSGTDTNGTLLSQMGATATGSTYLTNSFDGLAVGWRATSTASYTMMDVTHISVNTFIRVTNNIVPSLTPVSLSAQSVAGNLLISWPADHTGWSLQTQTYNPPFGAGSGWMTITNTQSTNQFSTPFSPTNGSVFFRLTYP